MMCEAQRIKSDIAKRCAQRQVQVCIDEMVEALFIDYLKRGTIKHIITMNRLTTAHQTSLLAYALHKCLRRRLRVSDIILLRLELMLLSIC